MHRLSSVAKFGTAEEDGGVVNNIRRGLDKMVGDIAFHLIDPNANSKTDADADTSSAESASPAAAAAAEVVAPPAAEAAAAASSSSSVSSPLDSEFFAGGHTGISSGISSDSSSGRGIDHAATATTTAIANSRGTELAQLSADQQFLLDLIEMRGVPPMMLNLISEGGGLDVLPDGVSEGARFALLMKKAVPQDQGDAAHNRAMRATAACLLHHNAAVAAAREFATRASTAATAAATDGTSKSKVKPPPVLFKLWDVAQKIRDFFKVGDVTQDKLLNKMIDEGGTGALPLPIPKLMRAPSGGWV